MPYSLKQAFLFAGCRRHDPCPAVAPASITDKAKGRSRSALDTIIAAVAEANDCIVVTDNEKDFEDVQIINPLRNSESREVGK